MSGRYYIVRGTLRSGPFTEQEMIDLLQAGRIDGREFCQREGVATPEPIADLFDIVAAPRTRGGESPAHPNDTRKRSDLEEIEPGAGRRRTAGDAKHGWDDAEEADAHPDDGSAYGEGDEVDDDEADDPARPAGYIVRAHPSFLRYGVGLASVAIVLPAGYFLAAYHDAFAFGAVAVASLLLAAIVFLRSSREYLVSRRRVEVVHGLIARSSREVRIEDIRAINVRKQGLLGLLGVGTVEFSSAGTDRVEVAFGDIRGPHRIRRIVRALQDQGD